MPNLTRRVVPIIFLTLFMDLLSFSMIIPILAPLLLDAEGILPGDTVYATRTQLLGFLISIYTLAQFLSAPLLGAYSDRNGRRRALFFTIPITILGYVLSAYGIYSEQIILLFIGRMISGAGAGNVAIAYSAMADISTPKTKVKNFGLIGVAFGLGFVVGPVIGGLLSDSSLVSWFAYDTPFWFAAFLAFLNMIWVWFRFSETLDFTHLAKGNIRVFEGFYQIVRAFKNRSLRLIFSIIFMVFFAFTFFTQFIQVYLIEVHSYSQSDIGFFFGTIGIWIIFTQGIILPFLSKRYNSRQMLRFSLLIFAFSYLILLLPQRGWQMYFAIPFVSIAQGLTLPNLSALLSDAAPAHLQGETLGMQQAVRSLAQLAPPLIGGFTVALAVSMPLWTAAIITIAAWVIFYMLLK